DAFLVVAAVITFVCTITGFLGRRWWIFDLTSHFRIQYVIVCTLIAIVWACRRRVFLPVSFILLALLNAIEVLPHLRPQRTIASPRQTQVVRVVLLNVRTENRKFDLVKNFLRSARPDLVVLEEVSGEWLGKLAELKTIFPYSLEEPREDNFGIALLSQHPLTDGEVVHVGEAEVPSVVARAVVRGTSVTVLGTHALPPGGREYSRLRNEQLEAIAEFLNCRAGPKLLLGDLNTTPWNFYFRRFINKTGLKDSSLGFGLQATWPATFAPLRIPLDHCLLSPDLNVVRRSIGPHIGSDHLPLLLDFAHEPSEGP
ncbi:MAG: endonuclease/exonuclease/phosphatase family protein, partial [Verrucomicrobiales bacterium]|nr:endonuclease/exonuclease/phosphatase family protein [Verrucomicrobiales bacterium]